MSDPAHARIAGAFLEWQRIEDAKDALAERSKELSAALKGEGYITKAVRMVFRAKRASLNATSDDIAKADEADAIADLYADALEKGLASRARPASARVEKIEEFPPSVTPGDDDGHRSEPSPEAGDAKMDEHASVDPDGEGPAPTYANANSGQAVPHSDDDFTPVAFLSREKKPLRPHCQNPANCGGYGAKHCHSCERAAQSEAA